MIVRISKRIGIAAGYKVADLSAHELVSGDDYPDFVVSPAGAVARGEVA